jgi:hypothetical protein
MDVDSPELKKESTLVDTKKLIQNFNPQSNDIDRRILYEITGA